MINPAGDDDGVPGGAEFQVYGGDAGNAAHNLAIAAAPRQVQFGARIVF